MPRLGSQRRLMAKNTMSTRPSQKGGMLPTTSEAPIAARSTTVCWRDAASTPTATPPTTARKKLAPARISVLPNLGSSRSTDRLVHDRREPQVAVQRAPEPLAVLHVDGLVEAEGVAELGQRLVGGHGAEQGARRRRRGSASW
jgi:hypothetical protein